MLRWCEPSVRRRAKPRELRERIKLEKFCNFLAHLKFYEEVEMATLSRTTRMSASEKPQFELTILKTHLSLLFSSWIESATTDQQWVEEWAARCVDSNFSKDFGSFLLELRSLKLPVNFYKKKKHKVNIILPGIGSLLVRDSKTWRISWSWYQQISLWPAELVCRDRNNR